MIQDVKIAKRLAYFEVPSTVSINDDMFISSCLRDALEGAEVNTPIALAEIIGFSLYEDNQFGISNWKTYYGPSYTIDSDNKVTPSFTLERITQDMVNYWCKRAQQASHPVLKSRYLGLVHEFSVPILKVRPDFSSITLPYIENLLLAIELNCYTSSATVKRKLIRIFVLQAKYRQQSFFDRSVALLHRFSRNPSPFATAWKWEFDFFVDKKIVAVSKEMIAEVIDRLEHRMETYLLTSEIDLRGEVPEVVKRLIKYYKKARNKNRIIKVLEQLESLYDKSPLSKEIFQSIHNLEILEKYYRDYDIHENADRISLRIQKLSKKLHPHFKVLRDDNIYTKAEVDFLIEDWLKGEPEAIIMKITDIFTPAVEDLSVRMDNSIMQFITKSTMDSDGRTLSVVSDVRDDEEGNLIKQTSEDLTRAWLLLRWALKACIDRGILTFGTLEIIYQSSPFISTEQVSILRKALKAYLIGDNIIFIHLIVPLLEGICLNILSSLHVSIWKDGRSGGKNLRILNDILEDSTFKLKVGSHISMYLRTVLTDNRGWNIRNNVAHGILSLDDFCPKVADRLMLVFLIVSQIDSADNSSIPQHANL